MGHFQSHTCKLGIMIGMVLIYFLVELVVGQLLHSITLVADSFHMLSDLIALIIGISARKISKWPKSSKNTFGWQRAEVVGTLLNTVMLTTLTFTIFIETIQRFIQPELIDRPQLLLGVGSGGLLINIIGLIILGGSHGHSHHDDSSVEILVKNEVDVDQIEKMVQGDIKLISTSDKVSVHCNSENTEHENINGNIINKHKSGIGGHGHSHSASHMNLKAVFLHVLADFFGSIAVVISALVIWLVPNFTDNPKGDLWKGYIDPSISLLMVFLILMSTIPLLKKSTMILLQSVPKNVSVAEIKERMEKIDGIETVHDLHVWLLQSDVIIGTVHIRCEKDNYVKVSKQAKKLFHDFNIHCTTIQAEFNEHAEDSNSNNSIDGGNYDACVLFCDDKSTFTGINECKAKQSCCPTKNSSAVALLTSLDSSDGKDENLTAIRVHPVLQHQQSAPCFSGTDNSSSTSPPEHIIMMQ